MKVTCNVDRTKWNHKPKSGTDEPRMVQKALRDPETIEIKELAEIVTNGGNFRPGAVQGGMGRNNFITGQMIVLDCDNEDSPKIYTKNPYNPEDVRGVLVSNGLKPAFQYYSWSHGKAPVPKFRTVLVLDKPISDGDQYEALIGYIVNLFEIPYADRSTAKRANIFYGSNKGVLYSDFEAVNCVDELLQKIRIVPNANEKKIRKSQPYRKKSAQKVQTANARVVEAIKNHDTKYLKRHIKNRKTIFDNRKQFYDYLYRIDLSEFLEVEEHSNFRCILDGHDDIHPSAGVYRTRYGVWQYKCLSNCQGDGTTLNIKQLVEVIGHFTSEYESLRFLQDIFNLKIRETDWSREQIANIDSILNCLSDGGKVGFKTICPTASAITRHSVTTYTQILIQARSTIYPEKNGTGDIIFYLSVRKLAGACGTGSLRQIQSHIKQLCYLRMLEPVEDSQVPKEMLKSALRNCEERHHHTSFYAIPSWVYERTRTIEKYGCRWKENGYRIKGISYEMFYRTEPLEAARLYPQIAKITNKNGDVVDRKTSWASDKRHQEIADIVLESVKNNGYCTEKMIIDSAKNKQMTSTQIARSITDICNTYNLKKCRSSKAFKEKYNIQGNGFPIIIIEA